MGRFAKQSRLLSTSHWLAESSAEAAASLMALTNDKMKPEGLTTTQPPADVIELAHDYHEIQNKNGQKLTCVHDVRQKQPR
jgi:hypothetical protein